MRLPLIPPAAHGVRGVGGAREVSSRQLVERRILASLHEAYGTCAIVLFESNYGCFWDATIQRACPRLAGIRNVRRARIRVAGIRRRSLAVGGVHRASVCGHRPAVDGRDDRGVGVRIRPRVAAATGATEGRSERDRAEPENRDE